MKSSSLWVALLAAIVATEAMGQSPPPVEGQTGDVAEEVERVIAESGVGIALDSIAEAAAPVLDETLTQLSATLGDLAVRVASDPELRRSAFAAAQGIAQLTSTLVAENADVIQEVLRKAAEELDRMGSTTDVPASGSTPSSAPSSPATDVPAAAR